jgi:hypothetical protein
MNFDLPRGDPWLDVVIFVEVCATKAVSLKIFHDKGFQADGKVGSCENYIDLT